MNGTDASGRQNQALRWSPQISFTEINGHAYVRSELTKRITKLNETGSQLWRFLSVPRSASDIFALCREAGIAVRAQDVRRFLDSMVGLGLLAGEHHEDHPQAAEPVGDDPYDEYLGHLARKETLPLSAFLEVTYACNEDCIHCAIPHHVPGNLSIDEYRLVLEQLRELGTLYLTFSGGEPFVRGAFLDILECARRLRFSVRVYTNGTLLNPRILSRLRQLGVWDLDVSIYGASAGVHDEVTRLQGSFEQTLANVRAMTESGMRVYLKTPVMSRNWPEVGALRTLADQLGARIGFFPRITAKLDGAKGPLRLRMSSSEYAEYLKDPFVYRQSVGRLQKLNRSGDAACGDLASMCSIDPWGDVRLCNELDIVGGNVKEQPLAAIWNDSGVFRKLRAMKASECRACLTCELSTACDRCPGLALKEDGDLYSCSSVAKWEAECLQRALSVVAREAVTAGRPRGFEGGSDVG